MHSLRLLHVRVLAAKLTSNTKTKAGTNTAHTQTHTKANIRKSRMEHDIHIYIFLRISRSSVGKHDVNPPKSMLAFFVSHFHVVVIMFHMLCCCFYSILNLFFISLLHNSCLI